MNHECLAEESSNEQRRTCCGVPMWWYTKVQRQWEMASEVPTIFTKRYVVSACRRCGASSRDEAFG
jgi:predicted nucleic-acid-binding Zn-ribbon protein